MAPDHAAVDKIVTENMVEIRRIARERPEFGELLSNALQVYILGVPVARVDKRRWERRRFHMDISTAKERVTVTMWRGEQLASHGDGRTLRDAVRCMRQRWKTKHDLWGFK